MVARADIVDGACEICVYTVELKLYTSYYLPRILRDMWYVDHKYQEYQHIMANIGH